MNEIEKAALQYTKAHPYIHVGVDDKWYTVTNEYKAFLEGAKYIINNTVCGFCDAGIRPGEKEET